MIASVKRHPALSYTHWMWSLGGMSFLLRLPVNMIFIYAYTDAVYADTLTDNHVWKTSRKAIQPLVTPQAVQTHLPISETETTQLLYDILHGPEVVFLCGIFCALKI